MASHQAYVVKPGDTLGKIAKAHNTTVAVLVAINGIADANKIYAGLTIEVPAPAGADGSVRTHKVQAGETLSAIANRYRVGVDAIVQANGLADRDQIAANQELIIPGGEGEGVSKPSAGAPSAGPSPAKPAAKKVATGAIDTPLPASGSGFVTYNREKGAADQHGTAGFVEAIIDLAAAWAIENTTPVSYGDMSRKGGGQFLPHAGHRKGNEVDIRPFRKDGSNSPVTIHDSAYDRATTREFLALLCKRHPGSIIFFNDPAFVAAGLAKAVKGHHNHVHIRLP